MVLNVYYYENLHLPDGGTSLRWIIWVLYAGILIGSVAATFDKYFCARFIAALLERGADAEERALLLSEVDVSGKWYLRRALRPGKPLRKMLSASVADADSSGTDTRENRSAVSDIRFYLPEDQQYLAQLRYQNGSHPIRTLIAAAVLLTIAAVLAQTVVPELLTVLDNLLGTL